MKVLPENMRRCLSPDDRRSIGQPTDLKNSFDSKWIPEPFSGCWLWTGNSDENGYGRAYPRFQRRITAHRLSWLIYRGVIPKGLCVLHRCDVPACVNPDHLFLGTRSDNHHDMMFKGRNKPPKGERNSHARLKAYDIERIRSMYVPFKRTFLSIAQEYGVSVSCIALIVYKKNWRHV